MAKIKGITVVLFEKTVVGADCFNHPVYYERPVNVENVLVAPESSEGVVTEQDLQGKKEVYILGIPKGDTHNWKDAKVEFFGRVFKTFGVPEEGIEDLIPLDWNKKVKVERYE